VAARAEQWRNADVDQLKNQAFGVDGAKVREATERELATKFDPKD